MKMLPRLVVIVLLAATAAIVPLSPLPARADDEDIKLLRTYPKLTADEMKQVPFLAMLENKLPYQVWFEIHNPFRDRKIAALVIGVSFKQPGDEKAMEFEILAHNPCRPLASTTGQVNCFDPAGEQQQLKPTITLKEVYLEPEPPAAGK